MKVAQKKTMALRFRGKALNLNEHSDRHDVVQALLDKTDAGELLDSTDLIARTGINQATIMGMTLRLRETGHSAKVGRTNFYGRPETIAELKRQIGG